MGYKEQKAAALDWLNRSYKADGTPHPDAQQAADIINRQARALEVALEFIRKQQQLPPDYLPKDVARVMLADVTDKEIETILNGGGDA